MKVRSSVAWNIVSIALIVAFRCTPLIHHTFIAVYYLALFAMWIVTTALLPQNKKKNNWREMLIAWMMLWFWQLILWVLGLSTNNFTDYIMKATYYCIPLMTAIVYNHYNRQEIKVLIIVLFVIVMANILSNEILYLQNPDLYLMMLKFEDVRQGSNVGSTTFVAMTLFLVPIGWSIFQGATKKIIKFIGLAGIVLSCWLFMFVNSRGTASFVGMALLLTLVFMPKMAKGHSLRSIASYIIALIVLAVIMSNIDAIFGLLGNVFSENERMLQRVTEVESFSSGEEEGSFAMRIQLYRLSLNTFVSSFPNFLFGKGDVLRGADDISHLYYWGVGGHSEFFDALAMYGIIGGLLYYRVLKYTSKFVKKLPINDNGIRIWRISFLFFIVYSFLNHSFYPEVFIVMFLLLPITLLYFFPLKNDIYSF